MISWTVHPPLKVVGEGGGVHHYSLAFKPTINVISTSPRAGSSVFNYSSSREAIIVKAVDNRRVLLAHNLDNFLARHSAYNGTDRNYRSLQIPAEGESFSMPG
eukprot:sb/3478241/